MVLCVCSRYLNKDIIKLSTLVYDKMILFYLVFFYYFFVPMYIGMLLYLHYISSLFHYINKQHNYGIKQTLIKLREK